MTENNKKPSLPERLLNFTHKVQNKAIEANKRGNKTIYGDISNRMFASMLDLCLLVLPIYFLTNLVLIIFFNNTEQFYVSVEKIHALVPAETFQKLYADPAAMWTFISQNYPHEMTLILRQMLIIKLFQFVIIGLYIIPFNYKLGATPGKILLGLKVTDNITGGNITLSQSVIRYLAYITAPIGLFSGGIKRNKRCWHDYIADTVVIYSPNRWYKRHADTVITRIKKFFNK